ncbi:phage major capsid protein [Xenorhabdus ishibashii]|uniref:Phage capsid protein n=1 Tax=Xenorhabdus ishibashii TaxID=1034471 RepID=A0A2D0KF11_9GAMM|nr:phage major capsid protein [Xenorhabdus ishibashii]PHM62033.1 phage capsid protein [Xenorhabdus ishibashii]
MKKLLELRQQKAALTEQMRTLLTKAETEKRSLTAEEAKQFDELRSQSDSLNAEIARYEALSDEERHQAKTQPTSDKLNNNGLRHYTPKMEEVSIKLFPIYAYPKTTQEIIDFSDVDILGWLTSEIADTFVDTEETDLVSGDGSKKAKGFLSYPRDTQADKVRTFGTLQKLEATKLEADSLIDLKFLLKNKYRKNAVWVMNSTTAAQVQKLKNGNGDYIWRERLQAGDPDMLLGLPVHYLEFMPDSLIGLGDFKRGYFIVDHETGTRTRPDNITEPGFYKVHSDKYLGGGLVDSNAIKVLEVKTASK